MAEENLRDFVIARLAAARSIAGSITEALDAGIEHFINPDEDKSGEERENIFKLLLDEAGEFSRAIECAQFIFEGSSKNERKEGEPDYDAIIGDDPDNENEEGDSEDDAE